MFKPKKNLVFLGQENVAHFLWNHKSLKHEADDAISLAKACFEPLINAVKKEIEKMNLLGE